MKRIKQVYNKGGGNGNTGTSTPSEVAAKGCSGNGVPLAKACEQFEVGEILQNCLDKDGTNSGFDIELINAVRSAVTIPVIASSGAGCAEHFLEVFTRTKAEAALAAGIFHRKEVPIGEVKGYLKDKVEIRPV